MFLFVALACCLSVSSASICCTPPTWEGQRSFVTAFIHNGKASTAKGITSMAYDSVNKRIGTYETFSIAGSEFRNIGVLLDYNTNTKYIAEVVNDQPVKCIRTALNMEAKTFSWCIPDDAAVVDQGVLGFGTNDANINTYSVNGSSVVYNVAVTANACVPVFEVARGNIADDMFIQNTFYFNITDGISNPDGLKVPPTGCENAPMVSGHYASENFSPSIVGKRSTFF